jgi:hypothetical protein
MYIKEQIKNVELDNNIYLKAIEKCLVKNLI